MSEPPTDAAITAPPDWVCAVLSDSTEPLDRGKKRWIYRREGIPFLWFVDPVERTLEVYQLQNERWREVGYFEADDKVRAVPFEAVELDPSILWA